MEVRKQKNEQGAAMVMVICIMAVFLALSMALLLASSVMVSNAAKTKSREEVRILTQTLADELEKDLTLTRSQREKKNPQELEGSIWGYVNEQIVSGAWESSEGQTAGTAGDKAKRTFQMNVQPELLDACEVELYWEQAGEDQLKDALLTVRTTCRKGELSCTAERYYVADDGIPAASSEEESIPQLTWIRSEKEQI